MGFRTCLGHIIDIVHYISGYDFVANMCATFLLVTHFQANQPVPQLWFDKLNILIRPACYILWQNIFNSHVAHACIYILLRSCLN